MLAAYASTTNSTDPLSALNVGEIDSPTPPAGWVPIQVKAASLNRHDLWALAGVALRSDQVPMILGTDATGIDAQGNRVIVHSVIGGSASKEGNSTAENNGTKGNDGADETLDPKRTLLSELHPGTLAQAVYVPAGNTVPLPEGWSFSDGACLPTAYLTAWRMLTTKAGVGEGSAVLIHGATGGVSVAAMALGAALGARLYVTGRDATRAKKIADQFGAQVVTLGDRLPEKMDVVIDSVAGPTVPYSLKVLRPGGKLITCGATAGHLPEVDWRQVFFRQLHIEGSTMGTIGELRELVQFCTKRNIRPVIDSEFALGDAASAFARLAGENRVGKIVVTMD